MKSLVWKAAWLAGAGLVAVALLAFYLGVVRDGTDDRACPPDCPTAAENGETAYETLAQRYAPVLYLREQQRECDRSGAAFEPVAVEAVLDNPEIVLRSAADRSFIMAGPSAADLFEQEEPTYLDFPGNPVRYTCQFEMDARRFSEGLPNVAYARIVQGEEEPDLLILQYWFFYYFNDWHNTHEGDWEMIQLVFEAENVTEALEREPVRAAYSQHGSGEIATWEDPKLEREGVRPVVYPAVGSQASFFRPYIFLGRGEGGAGFGCDDASPPHRRVPLVARLIPSDVAEVDGPDHPAAWLAYSGRWGQIVGPELDGPVSPPETDRWIDPLVWEETLRYSSIRVPGELVGPSATGLFCEAVAWASGLFLPIIVQLPYIAAAGLGIAVLGLGVSLTRTQYLPARARPLRARRRIGQILLSAAEIYRRRFFVFGRFGLVFLPIGAVVSVLQWVVLNFSPVTPVVPFTGANVFQEVVLWFALAEIQFGMAYALVIAAATAAIVQMERGESAQVRDTLRRLLAFLPQIVLPRLAATAIVTLLAATIIGIPLALRQAVRWFFIEQVVLFDNVRGRDALHESSRVVSADSLWTAASVAGLGLAGIFGPAIFGMVLLLAFTSLPVLLVNAIASLLYVALVPYVAIALALIYFDLRARQTTNL